LRSATTASSSIRSPSIGAAAAARGAGCAGLGMSIAAAAVVGSPVGIMLHHAVMTPEDFSLVGELLTVISSHPSARATELSSLPTAPVGDGRDEHAWPA